LEEKAILACIVQVRRLQVTNCRYNRQGNVMSNVIDFLERIGRDAQLRHGSQDEVEMALANAEIAPELRAAIIAKNQVRLEALLGQGSICCAFFPVKEGEEEGDETEEAPSRESDAASEDTGVRALIAAI
jgi:hypothetical protein